MDAIETETVRLDGQTYRITIYPDGDTPNPLDDWSEMGRILSLNRRHINFELHRRMKPSLPGLTAGAD